MCQVRQNGKIDTRIYNKMWTLYYEDKAKNHVTVV